MKIINFMGAKIGSGGIESFVANISKGLRSTEDNIEYIVVARYREENIYESEIIAHGGKVVYLSNKKCSIIQYYRKQVAFYKKNTDGIVWIHASFPGQYLYALIAKLSGVKRVVYHVHSVPNPSLNRKEKIKQAIYRLILKGVPDVKVACSIFAGEMNFGKEKFSILHNGFDCNRFQYNDVARKEIRDKYGLNGCVAIGQVGRLSYAKNQVFSMKVLNQVLKYENKIKLVIVGNGEDEHKLESLSEKYNMTDKVILVPATDEIEKFYSAFDILLFPSIYEGLGIAPLEAQCSGLNVVCSKNVTSEVAVTDLVSFVDLNDIDLWATKILQTQSNLIKRPDLSLKGINSVKKAGYTYENAYHETIAICKKLRNEI